MGLIRSHARTVRNRGSAMVEAVVILPIRLVMGFGVIEFGIAFQRWQVVTNAAREGARAAAVRVVNCSDADVRAIIESYVTAAGLTPGDVDITVPNTCVSRGTPIEIRVRHDFVFPVLSSLVPALADGVPLRGVAVMRKE